MRYASEETIARGSTDRRSACIGRDRLWHGAHRRLHDPLRGREGAARPAPLGGERKARRALGGGGDPREGAELSGLYGEAGRFRSTVDMARYRFGIGEYRYFGRPLPPLVEALRRHVYPPLAAIGNQGEAAPSEH